MDKHIVKKGSNASFNSSVSQSSYASKISYEKASLKPNINRPSSRCSPAPKTEAQSEKPEFTPMPDLLPDFNFDSAMINKGLYKTSGLVLFSDIKRRHAMLPHPGRARITAVKRRNPVVVLTGLNYDYADYNLGYRIRLADTNQVWGPGLHPRNFVKSFETLLYCYRTARIIDLTKAQVAWIKTHDYPALTASTLDFPWSEQGLTKELLTKLVAPR